MEAITHFLSGVAPYLGGLLVIAFALTLLVLAGFALVSLVGKTLPARVRQVAEEAQETAQRVAAEHEVMRSEWAGVLEEFEGLSEQVDKRRKRIQQEAYRLEQAQSRAGNPSSPPGELSLVEGGGETLEQATKRLLGG